jgi:hypothetical protein
VIFAVLFGCLSFGAFPITARAQSTAPVARVFLTSQKPWLAPGESMQLGLRVVSATVPRDVMSVAVTLCQKVSTRSEFDLTLQENRITCSVRKFVGPTPLTSIPVQPDGTSLLTIPLQDAIQDAGVYPLRVELRSAAGASYDHFVTHVVAVGNPSGNLRLNVGLILPIDATPTSTNGKLSLDADASTRLASLVAQLTAHPTVPLTLRPSPVTLDAMASDGSSVDASTLQALAAQTRLTSTRQLVTPTYVPVDVAAMTDQGLESEVTSQLSRAGDVVAATLQVRADPRTWVTDDRLGGAAVAALSDRGVDRLVTTEDGLQPIQQTVTPTAPFIVEPLPGRRLTTVAGDPGLDAHFAPSDQPVLAAHHLLAEMAVVYFDAPNARAPREVTAYPPRSWLPDADFTQALLDGLASSPILVGQTLDGIFSVPPAAGAKNRGELVRSMAPVIANDDRSLPGSSIRTVRRRLEGFGGFLDRDNAQAADLFDGLERSLLLAESVDLKGRQHDAAVDDVSTRIDKQLALIRLPASRSIQLTARTGEIPVTIISDAPYPVHVVLRLRSDKLVFPRGTEKVVDLTRRNTTTTFTVDARTSGAFPVAVSVESPGGDLVVGHQRITVRSTVASNVGLLLSVGTGLFLLVWWVRNFRHGRRAKRLVPA